MSRNRFSMTLDRARALPLSLLVAYVLAALLYSVHVPLYEAPDEPGHFDLIAHIVNRRSLPRQSVTAPNYAHHPPLYYGIAALPVAFTSLNDLQSMPQLNPDFVWPGQEGPAVAFHHTAETFPYSGRVLSLHLARLVSILAGLLTVILAMAIGASLFPAHKAVGLLAAALVAFNPQFLFVNSTVNNDSLLIAATTGALWQLMRIIQQPQATKQWVFLGVWAAAAILSKSLGLVVVGVIFACWLFLWARAKFQASYLKHGLALSLTMALLSGWWFVRNQLLYGDPLGWAVYRQAWSANLRTGPFTIAELPSLLRTQFQSFWGVFGWMNLYLPQWYYWAAGGLLALGAMGWIVAAMRGKTRALTGYQKSIYLIFAAHLLLLQAFLIYQNTVHNAALAQGRFLLPASVPIMFIAAVGLLALVPERVSWPAAILAAISLFILATYVLFRVIAPAYHVVPEPKTTLLTVSQRTEVTFDEMFALRGYEWSTEPLGDKTQLTVAFYWQAVRKPDFDYSVFVHVLDAQGQMQAQHDQAPGADDDFPPLAWKAGDIVVDRRVLEAPGDAAAGDLQLRVGVYNWQSGERLKTDSGADHIVLPIE
ncbi:MAG TPA: glycosyltransferase family 39 protein [Candidatus Sulfomarinibacteraceae bacterium]|nr:glycosyltransferase family 39 protein [Candidatus Sulfomarinibacteraceae bacterium]